MPLPDQPADGRLVHRPRPEGNGVSRADSAVSADVYCELSGARYTIHLSGRAVGWISDMGKLFKTYLEASAEAVEELAPLCEAIEVYIDAEVESISTVSANVPDGRVKLVGYLPLPLVDPLPDEGYVPPGSWNPPTPVNGLRWWTVNSINLYNGRWTFTATNSNPDSSTRSVYFSTEYDGNSLHITPRDFKDTYGWTALRGHKQFDSGPDTCAYVPRTGSWWLFSGEYCARTNGYGDQDLAAGEKDNWAGGISCATAIDNHYPLIAGDRVAFLDGGKGDSVSPWRAPRGITDAWPALKSLHSAGIMDGIEPKAVCWDTSNGEDKLFMVFHSVLFTNRPTTLDPRGFFYNFMACQSDTAHSYYTWNAMFNYLNSPWPYPSCG